MPITATFPTITFPHRGELVQDDFVLAQETAQDLLSGSLTDSLNVFKTEANALEANVNAKELSAASSASTAIAATNFKGTWSGQLTSITPHESWLYDGVIYIPLVAGTDSPTTTPSNWFALTIAQNIKNIPNGGISATTVQAAINELDTEKAHKNSPVFTNGVTISGNLIFEGATEDGLKTTLTVTDPTSHNTVTIPSRSFTMAGTDELDLKAPINSPAFTGTPTINGSNAVTSATLRTELNAVGSAPIYACRAWVNFNGTGTVAIRASGNVSSITDNGIGNYRPNLITAIQDLNYAVAVSSIRVDLSIGTPNFINYYNKQLGYFDIIITAADRTSLADETDITALIFR